MNPFNILIDHFLEFEFNNIYQQLFKQIIILITNGSTPENLVKVVFEDCGIIEKLIEYNLNNNTFRFK